ncbi:ATP-binding cassette domain-containing protein [Nakamurella sp.]|uniref:ABC transporter ATP-binding protein n=1 Tax=Nakamurella sp. TaxID=1869182 RepID=UPI003785274C
MAREDDDPEVPDTTVAPGSETHAWSAVDRPGTDPSDPRPQGPDTGGFADVPFGGPGAPHGSGQPTFGPAAQAPYGSGPASPYGPPAPPDGSGPGSYYDPAGEIPAGDAQPMRALGPAGEPGAYPDPGGYGPIPAGGHPLAIPGAPPQGPPQPPGPVLEASGLGLLGKTGWVFQNIDLTLRPTSVAAIVGPSGTGRSSLLLALSGRLRPTAGTLSVAGHSYRDKPSAIRQLTAVARVGAMTVPEPALTVSEYVAQRCLLEDVGLPEGRTRFAAACDALQLQLEPTALVGSLFGDKATLLAVAAACVRVSAVIVLDDLDRGVSGATQQLMLDALLRLATTGPTIVVTSTDRIPVMEADVVLDLTPSEGAAVWQFDRDAPLPAVLPGPVIGELAAGPSGPAQPPPDEAPTTVLPPQPGYPDETPSGFEPPPPTTDESSDEPPYEPPGETEPPTPPSDEPEQDRR